MALAELLLELVLLGEPMGGALERVSEDEARLIQDGELVAFLQFATLVSAN